MSFSSNVKQELAELRPKNLCCRRALTYGLLQGGHAFSGQEISLQTEHEAVAALYREQVAALLPKEEDVVAEKLTRRGGFYIVSVAPSACSAVLDPFGHTAGELSVRLNRGNLNCEACTAAYLRGLFLACGAVVNPETGYHLEFCLPYYNLCKDVLCLLRECGLGAKYICRKGNHVVYLKESEQIEDCLTLMGAMSSCLELMNIKMLKDIRNQANRIANCENANIDKQVIAASQQRGAIERLMASGKLSEQPEALQQLARLRLESPTASLRELGELCNPPMSRSGVNHRLQRLLELAEEL